MLGDPSALDLLLRAWILESAGATEALASYVSVSRDAVDVARVREVLRAAGRAEEPTFALALALAEAGGFIRLFVDEGAPMRLLIFDF